MDPLSDLITLLAPRAAVSKPITGRGSWGVHYQAHAAPGFTIILKGSCWISIDDDPPLELGAGDFLLLPSTPAFSLLSEPGITSTPIEPSALPVRHGEQSGDATFAALGGTFQLAPANAPLLLALLPRMIHVPGADQRADRIGRLIALIAEECAEEAPGKTMIVQRLLETLLIEALRSAELAGGAEAGGLVKGMSDPALARALKAIHENVRANWTVATLAATAGMSRSSFASRFSQVLECSPIEYLLRWRMALAKSALAEGGKTLDRIAEEIGYESASAFSTAFRKRFGCPPGRFGRAGGVILSAPG